ncbi:MAG: hypothetical protein ACRETA_12180 [Gammaproteobacteria bacterium]
MPSIVIDSHGVGHIIHQDVFGDIIHTYGVIDATTGKLVNGVMENLNGICDTSQDPSGNHFKAAPLNGPVTVRNT